VQEGFQRYGGPQVRRETCYPHTHDKLCEALPACGIHWIEAIRRALKPAECTHTSAHHPSQGHNGPGLVPPLHRISSVLGGAAFAGTGRASLRLDGHAALAPARLLPLAQAAGRQLAAAGHRRLLQAHAQGQALTCIIFFSTRATKSAYKLDSLSVSCPVCELGSGPEALSNQW